MTAWERDMNGAERLAATLADAGIEICFGNPGTSEMQFVSALDQEHRIRPVLGLFEGVVSGAADGYARMAGKPACTLLHLAPGTANAGANLHNARKARTPMVNIIGDHASQHATLDAPLTADVAATAACFSDWVRVGRSAEEIAQDAAAAVAAAMSYPGKVASLILPADTAWTASTRSAEPLEPTLPRPLEMESVRAACEVLRRSEPTVLILGGRVLADITALEMAGRIAAATGSELRAPTFNARVERGAGRVAVPRIPYAVDAALEHLRPFRQAILIETDDPVGFFAYPGKPSRMLPAHCAVYPVAGRDQSGAAALAAIAAELGCENAPVPIAQHRPTGAVCGPLDAASLAQVIRRRIEEGMIVVDEAITLGMNLGESTHHAAAHTWLALTGGSIGIGPSLAAGAALGAPDRPVLALLADGSALYTVQALWTQAREGSKVVNVVLANRRYAILEWEMGNVGANPGPAALDLFRFDKPPVDWVHLAKGFGLAAERVDDAESLDAAIQRGLAADGPYLIEAMFA